MYYCTRYSSRSPQITPACRTVVLNMCLVLKRLIFFSRLTTGGWKDSVRSRCVTHINVYVNRCVAMTVTGEKRSFFFVFAFKSSFPFGNFPSLSFDACSAPRRLRDAPSPKLGSRRPAVSQLPSMTPDALFLPLRSHPSTAERSNFTRVRASEIRGFPFAKFRAAPSSVLLIP